MTPAPGIVNEQGGYWADQPTHPQAPQWNKQVHRPYVQKPQCCEGYTWISPSGDNLWMRKSGEHQSRPYYTATDNGVDYFLYYATISQYAPPYGQDGYWYLSEKPPTSSPTHVLTQSNEILGMRYCPQDYQSKPYTSNMTFECGQGPPQQQQDPVEQCCNNYKWTGAGPNKQPGSPDVWMNSTGKSHNGRPVYEASHNGFTTTIYWKKTGQSIGAWFYSVDGIDGSTARQSANIREGMNSCPDQFTKLGWGFNLKCENPPAPRTCEEFKSRGHIKSMFITVEDMLPPNTVRTHCDIEQVMWQLVNKQVEDFVKVVQNSTPNTDPDFGKISKMHEHFPVMANKWRELTRKVPDETGKAGTVDGMVDRCGFENDIRSGKGQFNWPGTGYVNDCSNMCDDIKPVKTAEDMKAVLEEFLYLVETKFTKKDKDGKDEKLKGDCPKLFDELFTAAAFFKPYVGGKLLHLPPQY